MERITAIFNDPGPANQAVTELHQLGVWNVFFLQPHNRGEALLYQQVSQGARRGWLWGAFSGVVFGAMAALIPSLGPVVQSSNMAELLAAALGGVVAGGVVGGFAGLLTGGMVEASFRRDMACLEKDFTLKRIFIEVDVDTQQEEGEAAWILTKNGGSLFDLQQLPHGLQLRSSA